MAKKLDISKLAERLNQLNNDSNRGSGSNMGFLDIKDGRNVVRVLPPRDDMDSFGLEAWVHYGIGKTDSNKKGQMVVCPTTLGEDKACPVCQLSKEYFSLSKKKDDQYSKLAKSYFRKKRVYYNAISRDEDLSIYELREEDDKKVWWDTKKDEAGSPVKVLATGIGVFKDIIGLIVDPEYGDVTDAEEGLDLIITKTGSGQFNTKYDVKTVRKESEIGFDGWESALNDLKPLLKVKTYDEIATILDGKGDSTSEDTDKDADEGTDMLPDKNSSEGANDGDEGNDDLQAEIQAALLKRKRG